MEQNNMWKRYLIIGLIISLIFSIYSCKDNTFSVNHDYFFVNKTNYLISYEKGLEKFNVPPNAVAKFTNNFSIYDGDSNGTFSQPETFSPISATRGDTVVNIKFNNDKCLNNIKKETINSMLNIKNYIIEKIQSDRNSIGYRYTYTFTEADYNRAVTCP